MSIGRRGFLAGLLAAPIAGSVIARCIKPASIAGEVGGAYSLGGPRNAVAPGEAVPVLYGGLTTEAQAAAMARNQLVGFTADRFWVMDASGNAILRADRNSMTAPQFVRAHP